MADEIATEYADLFQSKGYTLKAFIGQGAFGRVFRAEQMSLGRDVAIKIFDNPINRNSKVSKDRFYREARLLGRLEHPSIPTVLTRGEIKVPSKGETSFIVMQFIEGQNLSDILSEKTRLKPEEAVQYIRQILDALDSIHKQDIFHRDVKPDNIVVKANGHCYLIDFGIGVCLATPSSLPRVTDGNQPGTYDYMAPELLDGKGRDPDARTDVYAAGVTLFQMLQGHCKVNLGLDPTVSDVLKQGIEKACNSDPDKRFQTAHEFLLHMDGLFTSIVERTQPSTALCLNHWCPGSTWGPKGFTPKVIRNTTARHCGDCGKPLKYPCTKCGSPFGESRYCPQCGNMHFDLPTCPKCNRNMSRKDFTTRIDDCSYCDEYAF